MTAGRALLLLTTSLLIGCSGRAAIPEARPRSVFETEMIDQRHLRVTIKNIDNVNICVVARYWPDNGEISNDPLLVVGEKDREWSYLGYDVAPHGDPEMVKLAPGTVSSIVIDVPSFYKSHVPDDRIVSVTWQPGPEFCKRPRWQ